MKLSAIAQKLGAKLIGSDAEVTGVASLPSATSSDLVFVDDPKHLAAAMQANAGAVLAGDFAAHESAKPVLISAQPRLAFARAAELLQPSLPSPDTVAIHPTAVVDPSARI